MSIAAGTRLGPYEITGAIGAGGMGEVYRARDTRLKPTSGTKRLSAYTAAKDGGAANRLIVFALAMVLAAGTCGAQSLPATASGRGAIDKLFLDAISRREIPGVVAIAADRKGILYEGAFGFADTGTARSMTVDAIFRIASMTKPITSVAAMQLVEQGRLRLDDPAEKYLPEMANLKVFETFDGLTGMYSVRPATNKLTVRHLLTHTSGLGYDFTSPVVRDFRPRAGEQYPVGPLLFEPGTQWMYGTGTDWVGRLVESISRQTLDAYFRDHILGPLQMADTFYNVPDDRQPRVTAIHRRSSSGELESTPNQFATPVTRFNGGGGLFSTATDYIHFLQMLLNGGFLGGRRILSASTIAMMSQNQIGTVGVRALKTALPERSNDFTFIDDGRDKWGLGFLITTDHVAGKRSSGSLSWGGIDNTYFWIDLRQGIAGVILMQYLPFADGKALAVYDAFERAVYQLKSGAAAAPKK